jgi:hypothetical protein
VFGATSLQPLVWQVSRQIKCKPRSQSTQVQKPWEQKENKGAATHAFDTSDSARPSKCPSAASTTYPCTDAARRISHPGARPSRTAAPDPGPGLGHRPPVGRTCGAGRRTKTAARSASGLESRSSPSWHIACAPYSGLPTLADLHIAVWSIAVPPKTRCRREQSWQRYEVRAPTTPTVTKRPVDPTTAVLWCHHLRGGCQKIRELIGLPKQGYKHSRKIQNGACLIVLAVSVRGFLHPWLLHVQSWGLVSITSMVNEKSRQGASTHDRCMMTSWDPSRRYTAGGPSRGTCKCLASMSISQ